MPAKLIAASFALVAFAAAIFSGLSAENPASTTLWRAMVAMLVSYPVAYLLGVIGIRAVREHVEQYKRAHPLEGENVTEEASNEDGQVEAAELRDQPVNAA